MKASRMKSEVVAALAALSIIGTVAAEVPLPANYVPLDWIESSGSEWIDTESAPIGCTQQDSGFVVTIEGNFTKYTDNYNKFQQMGALAGAPPKRYDLGITGGTNPSWTFIDKIAADDAAVLSNHVFVANFGTGVFTIDAIEINNLKASVQTENSTLNFILFARKNGNKIDCHCYFRMRSCQLSQNGVLVRDYVPCRSFEGVAGLWDKVEGVFHTNGNSTGAFKGSDENEAVFLNYLESSGTQYINTGYKPNKSTSFKAETRGRFMTTTAGQDYQEMGALPRAGGRYSWGMVRSKKAWSFVGGFSGVNTDATLLDEHDFVADFGTGVFKVDETTITISPAQAGASDDSEDDFPLFARMTWGGIGCHCNFRMRSCRLSQGEEIVRDFVPMRFANGVLGLYDKANDVPYPNNGSGTFAYGFTYTTNETTLLVRDGKFAADENFTVLGFDSVEKVGGLRLDASACLSYPGNLKLAKGVFSQQDSAAKSYSVNGTLAFVGGAGWAVDWIGTECDSFSATAVDLSQATADSPVVLIVNASAATLDPNSPVVLIGSGVVAGDETRFAISSDVSAQLEVENGQLLMRFADPNVPVRAEWTAGGEHGKMSDKGNWKCYNCFDDVLTDRLPTDQTTVTIPANLAGGFECPEGETLVCQSVEFPSPVSLEQNCDWRGLTAPLKGTIVLNGKQLRLKSLEGSGAFTDNVSPGGELVVDVSAGELTYSDGMELTGTLRLVKDGAGTFTVKRPDQAYVGGTEVAAGTLKLGTKTNPLGTGDGTRDVIVRKGATIDINHCYNSASCVYNYVELAGTICIAGSAKADAWTAGNIWHNTISLAGDATIRGGWFYFGSNTKECILSLNGHTLTLNLTTGQISENNVRTDATGGRIVIDAGILVAEDSDGLSDFSTADVAFTGNAYVYFSGSDLSAKGFSYDCKQWNTHANAMQVFVHGKYSAGANRPPITLQDGATLDLSALNDVWSAKGQAAVKGGNSRQFTTPGQVLFAEGKVYVDVHGREFLHHEKVKLVDWDAVPSDTVFKSTEKERCLFFIKENDGLYVRNNKGLAILIR